MSHFAVNVIVPKDIFETNKTEEFVDRQMEKFDENKETPRYVSLTKEQAIAKGRKEIEDYKNGTYAKYLKDKKKYADECHNQKHMEYISKEFPKKLKWSDAQVYAEATKYEEVENIGKDGEIYSTYNHNAKWDWYVIGGRWAGWLQNREKELETNNGFNFDTPRTVLDNFAPVKTVVEKKLIPFAVLTPDQVWHERAEMGWFATTQNENDTWDEDCIKIYEKYLDDYVVSVDCHI